MDKCICTSIGNSFRLIMHQSLTNNLTSLCLIWGNLIIESDTDLYRGKVQEYFYT